MNYNNEDMTRKFKGDSLEALSTQIRYHNDDAYEDQQEKGKVQRDAYYAYKALIPNKRDKEGNLLNGQELKLVEPVIRKAVSQVLATAKNTLLNDQVHAFIYRSKKDHIREEVAKAVTDRVNDILLRENDGDKIFTQAFKEAIITGDSFVKYYIQEDKTVRKGTIEEPVPLPMAQVELEDGKVYSLAEALEKYSQTLEEGVIDLTFTTRKVDIEGDVVIPVQAQEVVEALAEQRDITVEFGEESTTLSVDLLFVSGEIELVKVDENIVIEFVPLQDIYKDRYLQDTDITKADYVCHRISMARYEAYEQFEDADSEALELLSEIDIEVDYPLSNRLMNTQNAMTDGHEQVRTSGDDMLNNVFVYDNYLKFKCPETGKYELFQVITARKSGEGILCVKKIKCIPFVHYSAFPMNTSFWSESAYHYLYDAQKERTEYKRARVANAQRATQYGWIASKSLDPKAKRALLVSAEKPGVVIQTDNPNDLVPIQYHPLPPSINEADINAKDSINEEWSASVGQDLLDNGSNMSATGSALAVGQFEMKDKAICKNLSVAHTQLAMGILSLLAEDQQTISVEMNWTEAEQAQAQQLGEQLPPVIEVPIEDFDIKGDFIPDVNTPNDLATQAQTLVQGIQFAAQYAPNLVTPDGVHQAVDKLYEAASVYNTDAYIAKPDTAPLATNEEIQEMMQQLEERSTALAQAQHDNLVADSHEKSAKTSKLILENRQYQIDKKNEEEWKKAELAMESKELRADLITQGIETALDVITTRFNMDRAVVEAELTAQLGTNVKLGSYSGV
ncbi:portal protein [Vibrio owensii]|uniref:portal protein n=1 Tax=Vibrio owensii TaxID=696485 RepID=UPI00406935B1